MKSQDDIKMPVFPHGKTGTHIKYYNCQPFLTKKTDTNTNYVYIV